MKCVDFLAASECNSAWQRWRARRHAAKCPACAQVAHVAHEVRSELSAVEPLSVALREVWVSAADEIFVSPASRSRVAAWEVAGAASVLVVATICLVVWTNGGSLVTPPQQLAASGGNAVESLQSVPSQTVDASNELRDLLVSVNELQREIQATVEQAELAAARQRAERMISAYSQW